MFSQKKPYTAVTVNVERLTGETYDEDDLSGMPELVEVIELQVSGPAEAARAIRKKLKYGNVHRQLRALVILDGLIQNAGPRFQRAFADEPLLERLRVCGTSNLSDPAVRQKCRELFRSWAQFANTPGMERIARLHKELPYRKVAVTQEQSRVIRETENPFGDDEEEDDEAESQSPVASTQHGEPSKQASVPYGQTTGTIQSFTTQRKVPGLGSGSFFSGHKNKDKDKDKEKERKRATDGGKKTHRSRPFNFEAEKERMRTTIADSSIATTNLMNALRSVNREKERISENKSAVDKFEACKHLRRRILRYIHHVEDEQYLGSLLHANDELVLALMTFEQLDRSIDADSDSEDELASQAHALRMAVMKDKGPETTSPAATSSVPTGEMHSLHMSNKSSPSKSNPPPRPSAHSKPTHVSAPSRITGKAAASSDDGETEEEEDENDPFADRNAMATPSTERIEWV